MISYKNGNTTVTIESDGTKTREYDGSPMLIFPESMDLKITNYCDLSNYCKWCHENSDKNGQHADLTKTYNLLKDLPAGVELAIGGGNPLEHPDLVEFLTNVRDHGLIANITINQLHVKKFLTLIKYLIETELVKGVGISYSGKHMDETLELLGLSENIVFQLIIGINTLNQMSEICDLNLKRTSYFRAKVLLLGYKQFRKGKDYFSDTVADNIDQWYMRLPLWFEKMTIAFDNLSIKQLKLKRYFTDVSWSKFFMGDDGSHTFYIDMVNEKFSKNSTSEEKFNILDNTTEMFEKININKGWDYSKILK
jgi:MoaA/NifB/PqqE/SkfB family radical SAM enzyme